jgi:phosphatidate cytidylyltransferase
VFGVFYAGVPLSLLLLIRSGANGLLWMMVLTWVIWSTDTMALVGGRLFGRRKLAPRISPSKTVEGALTGLVFGIGMGTSILILAGQPIVVGVSLSIAASAMAIVGDLFESLLKRVFDVKDSSHLLPGHGGMMDRLDGFFGAVPVFYLLLLAYGLL